MNALPGVTIEVTGYTEAFDGYVAALAKVLRDRRGLHARMAADGRGFVQQYLQATPRHNTAEKLGATPTGHRAYIAKQIQDAADGEMARIRIPRSTGLGRAFGNVVILPGPGKTYLTIPDDPRTYGRVVRDFPEDTFKFAILQAHRPFPVLLFVSDGKVAYWLRRRVEQKQDRTLLPSDQALREVARQSAVKYLTSAIYRTA